LHRHREDDAVVSSLEPSGPAVAVSPASASSSEPSTELTSERSYTTSGDATWKVRVIGKEVVGGVWVFRWRRRKGCEFARLNPNTGQRRRVGSDRIVEEGTEVRENGCDRL
jgi:hypothetical protein